MMIYLHQRHRDLAGKVEAVIRDMDEAARSPSYASGWSGRCWRKD